MSDDIVYTSSLTAEQHHALFGWSDDPFETEAAGARLAWRSKEHHVLLLRDGEAASHVALLREAVSVGGEKAEVAGFGDVITVPKFERQGLAQRCMTEAQRLVSDQWRLPFGMLFTSTAIAPLYEKLGWFIIPDPVQIDQPGGPIDIPRVTMIRTFGERSWPEGFVKVKGLPW